MNNKIVGNIGEDFACGYLGGKGYKILARNFRTNFGEVDIIAKSPLKILTFIEVKTVTKNTVSTTTFPESYPHISGKVFNQLEPEDQLSTSKLIKFRKISEFYANNNPKLSSGGYQLDAVCIHISPNGDLVSIKHYENV